MKDREKEKIRLNVEDYINCFVEIILSNQMHYTGIVLTSNNEYIKLKDKYQKEILIRIDHISSIGIKGDHYG